MEVFVATNFEDHMRPGVLWLEDPRYAEAFEDALELEIISGHQLRQQESIPMAAHTNSIDPVNGGPSVYPSFINARFEGGHVVITMRGEPVRDEQDKVTGPGPQTSARFEQTDWDQFVAEATRERGLVPGG